MTKKQCTYNASCLYREFSRYDYCSTCPYWLDEDDDIDDEIVAENSSHFVGEDDD